MRSSTHPNHVDWLNDFKHISQHYWPSIFAWQKIVLPKFQVNVKLFQRFHLPSPHLHYLSSVVAHEATSNFTQIFSFGSNSRPRPQLFPIRTFRPANIIHKHKAILIKMWVPGQICEIFFLPLPDTQLWSSPTGKYCVSVNSSTDDPLVPTKKFSWCWR